MGRFGASPEASARGVVALLTRADARDAAGKQLRKPSEWAPRARGMGHAQAAELWELTTSLAVDKGVRLPEAPTTVR